MLLVLDVSTAPIDGAAAYITEPECPGNYKKAESIAQWHAEEKPKLIQQAVDRAALDLDLGRITGIGMGIDNAPAITFLAKTEDEEREHLTTVAEMLENRDTPTLIGYNSLRFDWPYLMRRGQYLGVPIRINLDRYKTPHIDLSDRLTHRGTLTARSLGFYVKRLGWPLQKPLGGAEEAQVLVTGKWDELSESLEHDVNAIRKLAQWMGVYEVMR